MEDNVKDYLKPTYFAESDDEEIKETARKIVGNNKGRKAVESVFNWVRDNFYWDIVENIGAKALMHRELRGAVCIDKVNLFVALVRSIELPARYVAVFDAELDNKVGLPRCPHMYAEVYLDGKWVDADVTFGEHTEKIITPSKFGEHKWKTNAQIQRFPGMTKEFIDMANKMQESDPTAKLLKEAIDKYCG